MAAPDYPAAVDWYKCAAKGGDGEAASNLNNIYTVGRGASGAASGVARSKRRAMKYLRKSAENENGNKGHPDSCMKLARAMYVDRPHAREIGHVGEAAGVATSSSAGLTEGHDVPPEVMSGVVHWLQRGRHDLVAGLERCRREALVGAPYCRNEGRGVHSCTSQLKLSCVCH